MEPKGDVGHIVGRRTFIRETSVTAAGFVLITAGVAPGQTEQVERHESPNINDVLDNVLPRCGDLPMYMPLSSFSTQLDCIALTGVSSTVQPPWSGVNFNLVRGDQIVPSEIPGLLGIDSGIKGLYKTPDGTIKVLIRGISSSGKASPILVVCNNKGIESVTPLPNLLYHEFACDPQGQYFVGLTLNEAMTHDTSVQLIFDFYGWGKHDTFDQASIITSYFFGKLPDIAVCRMKTHEGKPFVMALAISRDKGDIVLGQSVWEPTGSATSNRQVTEAPSFAMSESELLNNIAEATSPDCVYNPEVIQIDDHTVLIVGKYVDQSGRNGAVMLSLQENGSIEKTQVSIPTLTSPNRIHLTGLVRVNDLKVINHMGEVVADTSGENIIFTSLVQYQDYRFGIEVYAWDPNSHTIGQVTAILLEQSAVCSIGSNNMPAFNRNVIHTVPIYPDPYGSCVWAVRDGPFRMRFNSVIEGVTVPANKIKDILLKPFNLFISLLVRALRTR
jgi:hypothetical protein